MLLGQAIAVQPRITQAIEESKLTVLKGNTHPLAHAQFDRGEAPSGLALTRMLLVLQRSPEQETGLKKLLDDQQDKNSPNYHKWLTPEDFGQQFGPVDQDVQAVTSWLQSHGFQVAPVSKGRTVIEFSGSSAQVQEAFHTSIHKYVVHGEEHWANASDPQIPAALAPVVGGVLSLHNFRARPLYHNTGVVSRSKATGSFTPAQPLFTIPLSHCGVQTGDCYGVGPYDFATIYNVLPLWTASPAINGTGQTIAIVGETDINPQDVTNFRTFFGLPAPNLQIIHDGPAPGIRPGEETESDLDVEWSGAVAPGATIDFVVAGSTETTQGIHLSALHIIDNNLAPVMSESYGSCELQMGAAGNQFFNQLWQQAAAEGITVMIATGDSGSAVCENRHLPPPNPAQFGLQVSGYSSTPYNVAVGGTDFNDLTTAATYWNSTNITTTLASAKSYIPETTWNDTCTNPVFGSLLGYSTNAETNCNNSRLIDFVSTVGSSGGKSNCISSDGQNLSSCTGGYAKPAWQSALTPNDGARDVPDVSLFSAVGSPSGSFYLICEADQGPAACDPNAPTADFLAIGGTSASAPAFAGIMALVNQQTGSRQGNANYVLYKLATQQPTAFHDVTTGTIAMPCQTGSPNCTTSTTGDAYGILSGYNAIPGYDLATGLGSVNAFNLVTKWGSVTLLPSLTTLSSLTPTTITHGQPVSVTVGVAPQSGTGTATGLVSLVGGPTGNVTDFDSHTLSSGGATWTTSLLPGGSYNVTAHYPGDGNYGSSDSVTSIPVVVNKENSKVALGLLTFDSNRNVINSNATAVYGSLYLLRVGVTGTTCSSNSLGQAGCPSGSVSLTDNGNPIDAGTYALNNLGHTENQPLQLSGGSHAMQASYPGDNSFNAGIGNAAISITPAPTYMLDASSGSAFVGRPTSLATLVETTSSGVAPTGTVTFTANGAPISGTLTMQGISGTLNNPAVLNVDLSNVVFNTVGPVAVAVSYSGDTNYVPSSSSQNLNVMGGVTTSLSANTLNPQPGAPVTLTVLIDTAVKSPAPTGFASFDNNTDLFSGGQIPGTVSYSQITDTNGNAELQATMSFVPPTYTTIVQAFYPGDPNFTPASSNLVTIAVAGNDFGIYPNQSSVTASTSGPLAFEGVRIYGQSNYNGTINFTPSSCSGLPAESTCSFSPASIVGNGAAMILIGVTAPHATGGTQAVLRHIPVFWGSIGASAMLCLLLAARPFGPRSNKLFPILLIAFLLVLPSCGGGGSSASGGGGGGVTDPGTPKGTYTVTVTATNGSLTHTANFQLVVQ